MKAFFRRSFAIKSKERTEETAETPTEETYPHIDTPQSLTGATLASKSCPSPRSSRTRRRGGRANSKRHSMTTTLNDLPQEILDNILHYHTPRFDATSHNTITESILEFQATIHSLSKLSLLNSTWYHAIFPLLLSTTIVSAETPFRESKAATKKEYEDLLDGKVELVKRHSKLVKRLVLNSRMFWRYPTVDERQQILNRFQDCLAACTEIQSLDIISMDTFLLEISSNPQTFATTLFSHISSPHLHSLAIRAEPTDTVNDDGGPHYFLKAISPDLTRRLTHLDLHTWSAWPGLNVLHVGSSYFKVTLPSLYSLNISSIEPDGFSKLQSMLTALTKSKNDSSTIRKLSLSQGTVKLDHFEMLISINNIKLNLVHLRLEFRWFNPEAEFYRAPGVMLRACPRLRTFLYFIPCPVWIFQIIPSGLEELGLLIAKDPQRSAIFQMMPIVDWSNDEVRRQNVKRLLVDWEDGVEERKIMRDKKTLMSCSHALEVRYVERMNQNGR